ncbi:MAG: NblA-related protein [Cyanothece sp. SIO1E1]|nr:NblA-related protein [Cyanothece sp. SIO1E1]
MNDSMQLSLEQQFNLRSFETQVQQMSREQAQDFLVQLYRHMIVQETLYKRFIKHEWNIGNPPAL